MGALRCSKDRHSRPSVQRARLSPRLRQATDMVRSLQHVVVDHRISSASEGLVLVEAFIGPASGPPARAPRSLETRPRLARGTAALQHDSRRPDTSAAKVQAPRTPRRPWPCLWPVVSAAGFVSRHRETPGLADARSATAPSVPARRQPGGCRRSSERRVARGSPEGAGSRLRWTRQATGTARPVIDEAAAGRRGRGGAEGTACGGSRCMPSELASAQALR